MYEKKTLKYNWFSQIRLPDLINLTGTEYTEQQLKSETKRKTSKRLLSDQKSYKNEYMTFIYL